MLQNLKRTKIYEENTTFNNRNAYWFRFNCTDQKRKK